MYDQSAKRLEEVGAQFEVLQEDDLIRSCVRILEEGKAVGWFQGRMEFGPRALGARSILGDARSPQMQSVLNLKVKFRESFRPFAPSILEEKNKKNLRSPAFQRRHSRQKRNNIRPIHGHVWSVFLRSIIVLDAIDFVVYSELLKNMKSKCAHKIIQKKRRLKQRFQRQVEQIGNS